MGKFEKIFVFVDFSLDDTVFALQTFALIVVSVSLLKQIQFLLLLLVLLLVVFCHKLYQTCLIFVKHHFA